jgi:hypothetical protein
MSDAAEIEPIGKRERAKAANTMLAVPGVEFHQVTI